jgi:hypothetical protein
MNLGYESGDQVAAFDEKKTEVKNLVQVPLNRGHGVFIEITKEV